MAKRELSNTLKNLKFMQRAVQKEAKPKEQETKPLGNLVSPNNVSRKCMVIMEGDPHPGILRGRMSFQNFNPLVDKLNDDANGNEPEASTSASFQSGKGFDRSNSPVELCEMYMSNSNAEVKRKQPEVGLQTSTSKKIKKKSQANNESSSRGNRSSQKQSKHDKLDWNVLMPPKSQSKRS